MVKCIDCGFLTTVSFPEEDDWERQFPKITGHEVTYVEREASPSYYENFVTNPECFMAKDDLDVERIRVAVCKFGPGFRTQPRLPSDFVMVSQEVLYKERACDGFTPYLHGFSPKEHLVRQDDRVWREELGAQQKNWQASENSKNRKWQVFTTIIAGLFGVIGIVVGVLISKVL